MTQTYNNKYDAIFLNIQKEIILKACKKHQHVERTNSPAYLQISETNTRCTKWKMNHSFDSCIRRNQ